MKIWLELLYISFSVFKNSTLCHQSGILCHGVKYSFLLWQEFFWCVIFCHSTLVQHKDSVTVHNCVQPSKKQNVKTTARVISISVNNRHPSTIQERQKTILIEFAAFVTIFDSQTINTDREAANLTVDAVLTLALKAVNVEKWLKVRD